MKSILVGAVAYAPQIVPIWDTIREYANDYFKDIRLDYVLFSNYERQVQWLKEGKIDIAWNTNVAFIRSKHCTNITPLVKVCQKATLAKYQGLAPLLERQTHLVNIALMVKAYYKLFLHQVALQEHKCP